MKKKYFLVLWTLFLFSGYFLYFSPLSFYHLNEKWSLLKELEKKNHNLENINFSFIKNKFIVEKKKFFLNMGYSEKNQVIIDIRLPPITQYQNQNMKKKLSETSVSNNKLLSSLIFFFCLSLIIITYFILSYHKKIKLNKNNHY